MIGKIYKGFRWVGDRAKRVYKWVGSNKKHLINAARFGAKYAPVVGGAIASVNPIVGGAIAGAGKALDFVADHFDDGMAIAKKGIDAYDVVDDGIQKVKRKIQK